jgi:hypothetical protein
VIRTQKQIVERIRTNGSRDPLGMTTSDLLEWLDFSHAKEFLKSDATVESWDSLEKPKPVREQMVEYMPFAWEKANNCRGLSAGRSMSHYSNWLWLIGKDELADSLIDYEFYGKDELVRICEFLGLDAKQWDDGRRVNSDSE